MIDLHSHTDQSDGTFTPAELVAEAVRVGLTALAITDHDTFAGYDAAVPFAAAAGLELICGIELSTRYQGASVHLLGYFPRHAALGRISRLARVAAGNPPRPQHPADREAAIARASTSRSQKSRSMGTTLTGRPHFARVLVEKGYAKDIQDAFDQYLDESARGFVQRQEVPMEEALERILASGGVPSLAHPVRVAKNNWEKLAAYVEDLAGLGHARHRGLSQRSQPGKRVVLRVAGGALRSGDDRRLGFPRRQQAADLAGHGQAQQPARAG